MARAPRTRSTAPARAPRTAAPARTSTHPPKRRTATTLAVIERVRAICMALPDVAEVEAWAEPTWRVAGHMFAMFDTYHHGGAHLAVHLAAPPEDSSQRGREIRRLARGARSASAGPGRRSGPGCVCDPMRACNGPRGRPGAPEVPAVIGARMVARGALTAEVDRGSSPTAVS